MKDVVRALRRISPSLDNSHARPHGVDGLRRAIPIRSANNPRTPVTLPDSRALANRIAVYVQISGRAQAEKCDQCIKKGPLVKWSSCVMASEDDSRNITKGSCASCVYNYRSKCLFYQNPRTQSSDDEGGESVV